MVLEPEGLADGTPAPYGRACTNCARAKCRCIYRNDGGGSICQRLGYSHACYSSLSHTCTGICDGTNHSAKLRCHRLKKECVPSVSARTRSNKPVARSKTARLEEKLDGLVSLLRHQNNNGEPSQISRSAKDTSINYSLLNNQNRNDEVASSLEDMSDVLPSDMSDVLPSDMSDVLPSDMSPYLPPAIASTDVLPISSMIPNLDSAADRAAAEAGLRSFRSLHLEFFPCVYISPSTTSEKLRGEKPFLWLTILAVTCPSATRQASIVERFHTIVAQKLVIEHEKSIDLLLGLLVFLCW
jgi:hypothetical protein